MSDPKVSVCIPTWQSAQYISRAIESVLAQRFSDFELLISDNASDDTTAGIVSQYMDRRIRYRRHSRNLGYTANVHSCIQWARGKYVIILCADDWWSAEILTPAVALLDRYDSAAFVYTAYHLLYEDDPVYGSARKSVRLNRAHLSAGKDYIFEELLNPQTILSAMLFRREAALAAGSFADSSFQYLPDKDHRLRMALGGQVACIDEPLVLYRVHPASLTSLSEATRWFDEEIRIIQSAVALAGFDGEQARKWQRRCNRAISEAYLRRLARLKSRNVPRGHLLALTRRIWQTSKQAFASFSGIEGLLLGLLVPSPALNVLFRWRRWLAHSETG